MKWWGGDRMTFVNLQGAEKYGTNSNEKIQEIESNNPMFDYLIDVVYIQLNDRIFQFDNSTNPMSIELKVDSSTFSHNTHDLTGNMDGSVYMSSRLSPIKIKWQLIVYGVNKTTAENTIGTFLKFLARKKTFGLMSNRYPHIWFESVYDSCDVDYKGNLVYQLTVNLTINKGYGRSYHQISDMDGLEHGPNIFVYFNDMYTNNANSKAAVTSTFRGNSFNFINYGNYFLSLNQQKESSIILQFGSAPAGFMFYNKNDFTVDNPQTNAIWIKQAVDHATVKISGGVYLTVNGQQIDPTKWGVGDFKFVAGKNEIVCEGIDGGATPQLLTTTIDGFFSYII